MDARVKRIACDLENRLLALRRSTDDAEERITTALAIAIYGRREAGYAHKQTLPFAAGRVRIVAIIDRKQSVTRTVCASIPTL